MDIEHLVEQVKAASEEVYKTLGAGYNESVYEEALGVELRERKSKKLLILKNQIF